MDFFLKPWIPIEQEKRKKLPGTLWGEDFKGLSNGDKCGSITQGNWLVLTLYLLVSLILS